MAAMRMVMGVLCVLVASSLDMPFPLTSMVEPNASGHDERPSRQSNALGPLRHGSLRQSRAP